MPFSIWLMLDPNLYILWRDLVRLWYKPIRIFEIGTCYRKESQGATLNRFSKQELNWMCSAKC